MLTIIIIVVVLVVAIIAVLLVAAGIRKSRSVIDDPLAARLA